MEQMGKLMEESMNSGMLVSTGGLLAISKGGARIQASAGEITVLDAPVSDSAGAELGYAILEASTRDAAVEMAKKFIRIAGDGQCDLRQMMERGGGR
jgi:hypothetical protein